MGAPTVRAGRWRRWIAVALLGGMALGNVVALADLADTTGRIPDFFAFWSFGRFVALRPPAAIYDPAAVHDFQLALGIDTALPFRYPPPVLLLLAPLARLPYPMAFAAWVAATFAVYLASLLDRDARGATLLAVLAAPATAVCIALGQMGFLIAGLEVAGLRLSRTRPLLAGVLLGFTAVKPQLATLLPVALVAARLWRTLAAAAATVAAMAVASALAFGGEIWWRWAEAVPRLGAPGSQRAILAMMPTVAGNLTLLGAGERAIASAQLGAAAAAAWAVWHAFHRGAGEAAIAALLAAGFLATPYAMIGDLPLLAAAVLLLIGQRTNSGVALHPLELVVLGLAVWLPRLMIGLAPWPMSAAVIAMLLAVAVAPARERCGPRRVAPRKPPC